MYKCLLTSSSELETGIVGLMGVDIFVQCGLWGGQINSGNNEKSPAKKNATLYFIHRIYVSVVLKLKQQVEVPVDMVC